MEQEVKRKVTPAESRARRKALGLCSSCRHPAEPGRARCLRCKEVDSKGGKARYLKDPKRRLLKNQQWRQENPEKVREHDRKSKAKHADKIREESRLREQRKRDTATPEQKKKIRVKAREAVLRKKYGLTPEQFSQLKTEQGNQCPICSVKFSEKVAYVDHCHTTGRVRGVLCLGCNLFIGNFRDDPVIMEKAIAYLDTVEQRAPMLAKFQGGKYPRGKAGRPRTLFIYYNLTVENFELIFDSQDRRCAICGTSGFGKVGPCVEHCHRTKRLRGITCNPCNAGLGHSQDSTSVIRSAINYLRRYLL